MYNTILNELLEPGVRRICLNRPDSLNAMNPELIKDGVSGLTVPYDDIEAFQGAIARVLKSEDLRERLIAQARVRTRDFDQDTVVEEFVAMINTQIWQRK